MKKAYVKPVFLAEEFVAETSYASGACGPASVYEPLLFQKNDVLCDQCNGDKAGGQGAGINDYYTYTNDEGKLVTDTTKTYWQYAGTNDAKMFNSGLFECDFVWEPKNATDTTTTVWVWDAVNVADRVLGRITNTLMSFTDFFAGNNGTQKKHNPGYEQHSFFS